MMTTKNILEEKRMPRNVAKKASPVKTGKAADKSAPPAKKKKGSMASRMKALSIGHFC